MALTFELIAIITHWAAYFYLFGEKCGLGRWILVICIFQQSVWNWRCSKKAPLQEMEKKYA